MKRTTTFSCGMVAVALLTTIGGSMTAAQDPDRKQEQMIQAAKAYLKAVNSQQEQANAQAYNTWLQQYNDQLSQARYRNVYDAYAQLVKDPQQRSSRFWIGAQCVPAGRVKFDSHIPNVDHLFREGGLRVNSVTADSPAAKAGLKKDDVILIFNKKPVNQINELSQAVSEAKTGPCLLQILRQGKVIELTLTPQERPKSDKWTPAESRWRYDLLDGSKDYWSDLGEYQNRFQVDPGAFWSKFSQLPKDVEVVMQRKGNQDPIVIVKKGNDQWTIRDGKVDELPKDLQGYVAHIYNASKKSAMAAYLPYRFQPLTVTDFTRAFPAYSKQKVADSDTAAAIKALTKKVEQLQKAVEEIKKD